MGVGTRRTAERARRRLSLGVAVLGLLVASSPASAAPKAVDGRGTVTAADIASPGPLSHIYLGNDLSCQVQFAGDAVFSFFPSTAFPGDCGTSVAVDPQGPPPVEVFGPDYADHSISAVGNQPTPYDPVSQSAVTGNGSPASPFTVTTTVDTPGLPFTVTRVDTYVIGNKYYDSSITVSSTSLRSGRGGVDDIVLYHAGDCFLAESDFGFGAFSAATGSVFCTANPLNNPPARVIGFIPLSPGSAAIETFYQDVWSAINGSPFTNFVEGTEFQDNGAGLSYSFSLAPGESQTRGVRIFEDPRGGVTDNCQGRPATIIGGGGAVSGTGGNDVIVGTDGKDKIRGKGGNDRICGVDGKDKLKGGAGKDKIKGGKARDRLNGGGGKDKLKGNGGRDVLNGGGGNDKCKGGPGRDTQRSC